MSSSIHTVNTQTLVDITKTKLQYIEQVNSKWHAVSNLLVEDAIRQAQLHDTQYQKKEPLGPLHGQFFLIKELFNLKGITSQFGSKSYYNQISKSDADCISRLKSAGAILLGTTHMVEFAIGSWGTNSVLGTPWNPADSRVHRIPGGSSSGSAVAVAANMVSVAIGSDTGGSIRIPASICGVIGYKPTYQLISNNGVEALGESFDTVGPITRNVQDARIFTEVMSGKSLEHTKVSLKGLNIAVVNPADLAPIDNDIKQIYMSALDTLQQRGATIQEISLPITFSEFQVLNGEIVAYEIYQRIKNIVEDLNRPIDKNIRQRVLAGKNISKQKHTSNLKKLETLRDKFKRQFADYDALALPSTPLCAVPVAEVDESEIPLSRYTRIANCLNLCAISLPLGISHQGLPIGWQLCALADHDAFLLALAQTIEHDEVLGKAIRDLK